MEELIKVSVVALLGVLVAIQFKGIMLRTFSWMSKLFEGADSYLSILLKVIGITYLCEFTASVCKDAGYGTVADQIEVLGKLSVMFAGLPILLTVVEQIQSYMG